MCDVGAEETVSVNTSSDNVASEDSASVQPAALVNTGVQTADEPPFNVERYAFVDAEIHHYTGLESYNK